MYKSEIFGAFLLCSLILYFDWCHPFLCSSFLPQDRVSEFAAMSPQQLLRETQRAAGDENLTNWHDTLISAGQELKTLQLVGIFMPSFYTSY
jgi:hypothetical protein